MSITVTPPHERSYSITFRVDPALRRAELETYTRQALEGAYRQTFESTQDNQFTDFRSEDSEIVYRLDYPNIKTATFSCVKVPYGTTPSKMNYTNLLFVIAVVNNEEEITAKRRENQVCTH